MGCAVPELGSVCMRPIRAGQAFKACTSYIGNKVVAFGNKLNASYAYNDQHSIRVRCAVSVRRIFVA